MAKRRHRAGQVLKSTGQQEPFSARKLYRSLRAAGAGKAMASRVVEAARKEASPGIGSRALQRLATKMLRRESPALAARYGLRNAVIDFGPSGYNFEKLVAALLEAQGYRTQISVVLPGKCVTHEVDVVARRNDRRDLIECKFRNSPGIRCDVKVTLYIQARALDLRASTEGEGFDRFRLVTNARFTGDAIQYAECVGLDLLGWNYPREESLQSLLEKHRLQPITCLTSLTKAQKSALLKDNVLLCRDLEDDPIHLERLKLKASRVARVQREIREICP